MAFPRIGGPGVGLDLSTSGAYWSLQSNGKASNGFNEITLGAGSTWYIPSGTWQVNPGPYTFLQFRDPVTGLWRSTEQSPNGFSTIGSDGYNWRLANLTGCALGALITNSGSGYTSAPSIAASAGGSTWQAIVGGAINATVTITAGGTNYTYPPILLVSPPPAGGIAATMHCTISSGAINAVTVDNQGSGYSSAPSVLVVNDPRDTTGSGGIITVPATLVGSGEVTGVLCTNHGTAVTSVPTLTPSGGGGSSFALTAVMCFTATGFTVGTAGTGYGTSQPFGVVTVGGIVAGSAGTNALNPTLSTGLLVPRMANIQGTSSSGGAVTATGAVVYDGGLFQAVPTGLVIGQATGAIITMTVGGTTDTSIIQPI